MRFAVREIRKNVWSAAWTADPTSPAPDGVFYALEQMGVTAEEAVFVGDSEVDMQTARNAKLDVIGVLWGFRDEAQLRAEGVKTLANTPAELKNMLLKLKSC